MNPTLQQHVGQAFSASPSTNYSINLAQNSGSGNLIVVGLTSSLTGWGPLASSVTDDAGNTYTLITGTRQNASNGSTEMWYCYNSNPGATKVTFTVPSGWAGGNTIVIQVREYNNIITGSDPFDQVHKANGSSGTTVTSGATPTTTQAQELVVGLGISSISGQTYTAGAGYGNLYTYNTGANSNNAMEDQVVSSVGAQTATFTVSPHSWSYAGAVATFKAQTGTITYGTVGELTTLEATKESTVAIKTDLQKQTSQVAILTTLEGPLTLAHQIDIVQGNWTITGTSWGLIPGRWKYTKADYSGAIEAYVQISLLSSNSIYTAYAQLYDITAGAFVNNTQLSTTSTTFANGQSSTDISAALVDGHEYGFAITNSNASGQTSLIAGRVIIKQKMNVPSQKTLTHYVAAGISESITGTGTTSYQTVADQPILLFDTTWLDGTLTTYLEATLGTSGATTSDITYAQLYDKTAGAAVSGSQIQIDGTTSNTRVRSGAITLVSGHEYVVQIKQAITSDTASLQNAFLIINQVGGTKTEFNQVINVSVSSSNNTGFAAFYAGMLYNMGFYTALMAEDYFEATMKSANAAGQAQGNIYDPTINLVISGTSTATGTTYSRQRSSQYNFNSNVGSQDLFRVEGQTNNASYAYYITSARVISHFYLPTQKTSTVGLLSNLVVGFQYSTVAMRTTLEAHPTYRTTALLTTLAIKTQKTLAILTTLEKPDFDTVALFTVLSATKNKTTAIITTLQATKFKTLSGLTTIEKTSNKTLATLTTLEKPVKKTLALFTTLEEYPKKVTIGILTSLESAQKAKTLAILVTLEKPTQKTVGILVTLQATKNKTVAILTILEKAPQFKTLALKTILETALKSNTVALLSTLEEHRVSATIALLITLETTRQFKTIALFTGLEKFAVTSTIAIKTTFEVKTQKTTALLTTLQSAPTNKTVGILTTLEKPVKSTVAIFTTLEKIKQATLALLADFAAVEYASLAMLTSLEASKYLNIATLADLVYSNFGIVGILTILEANIANTTALLSTLEKPLTKTVALVTILEKYPQYKTIAIFTRLEVPPQKSTTALLTSLEKTTSQTVALQTILEATVPTHAQIDIQNLFTTTTANVGQRTGVRYRGFGFKPSESGYLTAIAIQRNKGTQGLKFYIDTADVNSIPLHTSTNALYSFTVPNSQITGGYQIFSLPQVLPISADTQYVFYIAPWDTINDIYADDLQAMYFVAGQTSTGKEVTNNNGTWSNENLIPVYTIYLQPGATIALQAVLDWPTLYSTVSILTTLSATRLGITALLATLEATINNTLALQTILETVRLSRTLALKTTLEEYPKYQTLALKTTLEVIPQFRTVALATTLEKPQARTLAVLTTLESAGDKKTVSLLTIFETAPQHKTLALHTLLEGRDHKTLGLLTSFETAPVASTLALLTNFETVVIETLGLLTILEGYGRRTLATLTLLELVRRKTLALHTSLESAPISVTIALQTILEGISKKALSLLTTLEVIPQQSTVALQTTLETAPNYFSLALSTLLETAPVNSTIAISSTLEAISFRAVALQAILESLKQFSTIALFTTLEEVIKTTIAIQTTLETAGTKQTLALQTRLETSGNFATVAITTTLEGISHSRIALSARLETGQHRTLALSTLLESAGRHKTLALQTLLESLPEVKTLALATRLEGRGYDTLGLLTIMEFKTGSSTLAILTTIESLSQYSTVALNTVLSRPQVKTLALLTFLTIPAHSDLALLTNLHSSGIEQLAILTNLLHFIGWHNDDLYHSYTGKAENKQAQPVGGWVDDGSNW